MDQTLDPRVLNKTADLETDDILYLCLFLYLLNFYLLFTFTKTTIQMNI